MPGRDQSFYTSTLKRTTAPQIDSTSTNIHFEPLEPRLLLSASDIDPNLVESISASAQQVVAPADAADSINQQQTQYDNFFWPNTISFDFAIDPDAIDGLIDITALSDLNGTGETVAYDIEGIVAGTLFTAEDDGLRPFTASIQISDARPRHDRSDGNLHIEFTPSSNVDDYYDVQEYVTVALSYQVIQTGSISGLVWADINADGTHDPDEPGRQASPCSSIPIRTANSTGPIPMPTSSGPPAKVNNGSPPTKQVSTYSTNYRPAITPS